VVLARRFDGSLPGSTILSNSSRSISAHELSGRFEASLYRGKKCEW
jgi:hypothetical protein